MNDLRKKTGMLEAEKDVLKERLAKALNDKTNNSDLQKIQKERLDDVEKKISDIEVTNAKLEEIKGDLEKKIKNKSLEND